MDNVSPAFGLFLPQVRLPYETLLERTLVAEGAGFDTVWFIDHLWTAGAPELDVLEGWTTATAIAARTERIRVGHMVLCDAFRHPALLAKMAVTLDHISGGRLELGLGWGSLPDELKAFGFGSTLAADRSGRMAETLEVLQLLFTGESVTYTGRFFELDGAFCNPTPLQQPIPIHIGGGGERLTLPLVRRFAQWWNCPSYAVDRLDDLLPHVGDARVSVQHPVAMVMDETQRAEVEEVARRRFSGWGGIVVGNPEEIADALNREIELGVERFVIQLWDFARPESIKTFAQEIIPRFR
jgi:alkanesulfonate monooxygenase SsuD/methylene tetrahydromethanopterin reductase-like flavin-dependent oxidoreductase (luciferase family)